MTKRVLGVLAALAMVSGSVVACSSTSETTSTPDTGVKPDVGTDAKADTKPAPVDAGDTAVPTEPGTTGKGCADDAECDKLEDGSAFCSPTGFTSGSLYPTPVCFWTGCDTGDGTKIEYCDKDLGVCLDGGGSGICLPLCQFDDTGAAPKGCEGKNKCNVYGWGKDTTSGAVVGVGYCFGGCVADTDCPTGNKCQKEDGLCVKAPVTYAKKAGDACTPPASGGTQQCNCLYTTADKAGYCADTCYFGVSTCGTGFTCDSMLPKTKIRDTDEVFTKVPTGMAGYCLKDCTADADCAGLNAYCDENAGTGKKTCQIGKRPCVTDTQCPTGQTCTGATTTSVGRCG